MHQHRRLRAGPPGLPGWLPAPVRLYLAHVEGGESIRALARAEGRHASTVLRQIRRTESLRDDPLADAALARIGRLWWPCRPSADRQEPPPMMPQSLDDAAFRAETLRALKTLCAPEAELLVGDELADAALVLNPKGGRPSPLGTLRRDLAESLLLRGLICGQAGRALTRYRITPAGRAEMLRLTAERESRRAGGEDPDAEGAGRPAAADRRSAGARARSAGAESPLTVLARRRAPDGGPFLSSDLVAAGLRFRTGFEIARMEPGLSRDWQRLLAGRIAGGGGAGTPGRRLDAMRELDTAIRRLGPELSEVVLLAICEELGMEAVEEKLGFSARSGKNILKIALQMLARHYEGVGSERYDLIG